MKREGVKKKTSNKWSKFFQITLKGGDGSWGYCLEEFWPFNAFVKLQVRFSNHQLMKISLIYPYKKPEVKKNDTTAMTAAINEACIGWLHGSYYLVRGIFLVQKMSFFLLLGRIIPPSTGFPPNGRFGAIGRAVPTWWGQKAR